MAEVYKILGQVATTDTTEQVLYTSPASTQAIITNITAVNRTSSAQTFDVNVYNTAKTSGDLGQVSENKFVTIGQGSGSNLTLAATSTDGITWTARTMPSSGSWGGPLAFGNNTFVTTKGGTTAATSTDGITWTERTLPSNSSWVFATYGDNKFVFISGYGQTAAAISTDGITWSLGSLPAANSSWWYSVTYGNATFVAVSYYTTSPSFGNSSSAASSTDGITWTARTLPATNKWSATIFGNNTFVAVGDSSTTAASSTNGITWTLRTLPTASRWVALAYGSNTFVAVARYTTTAASSTDGITWTTRTMPSSADWYIVTYGNSTFVATSNSGPNSAASSTDGITWTLRTLPLSGVDYMGLAYGLTSNPYVSPQINNIYKGATIQANASEILEPGIVLGAQNTIVVKGTANTTFSVYGVELS